MTTVGKLRGGNFCSSGRRQVQALGGKEEVENLLAEGSGYPRGFDLREIAVPSGAYK